MCFKPIKKKNVMVYGLLTKEFGFSTKTLISLYEAELKFQNFITFSVTNLNFGIYCQNNFLLF